MLTILLILFAGISAFLGSYLLSHRQRQFLVFDPTHSPLIHGTALYGGSYLLMIAILSVVAVFVNQLTFLASVLALGCLGVMVIAIILALSLNQSN